MALSAVMMAMPPAAGVRDSFDQHLEAAGSDDQWDMWGGQASGPGHRYQRGRGGNNVRLVAPKSPTPRKRVIAMTIGELESEHAFWMQRVSSANGGRLAITKSDQQRIHGIETRLRIAGKLAPLKKEEVSSRPSHHPPPHRASPQPESPQPESAPYLDMSSKSDSHHVLFAVYVNLTTGNRAVVNDTYYELETYGNVDVDPQTEDGYVLSPMRQLLTVEPLYNLYKNGKAWDAKGFSLQGLNLRETSQDGLYSFYDPNEDSVRVLPRMRLREYSVLSSMLEEKSKPRDRDGEYAGHEDVHRE